jgi:hypothetical protein
LHKQAISALLADNMDYDSMLLIVNIKQHPYITQTKFPPSDRVWPQGFDFPGGRSWLVFQMNIESRKNYSSIMRLEPGDICFRSSGNLDHKRLGHNFTLRSKRSPSRVTKWMVPAILAEFDVFDWSSGDSF